MAFIYQADIFCHDCGDEIRDRILAEAEQVCADIEDALGFNPDDETSYDSDQFPKYANDDEESDCPQHCGSHEECINAHTLPSGRKIGCLIGTNLTGAGVEYVREAIERGGEVAEFWEAEFRDYF